MVSTLTQTDGIHNKTILITGTSSGIGLATAVYLAGQGHIVYGMMRKTSKIDAFEKAMHAMSSKLFKVIADITNKNEIDAAVKYILTREKKIDVVINNAGYGLVGTVESCTLEEQMDVFNVNYFGIVRIVQAILPQMRAQESGHIINISSCCGIVPFPVLENYSASKFALEGLSESMAVSLSPWNIKVSVLETGSVKTPAAQKEPVGTRVLGPFNPYSEFQKGGNTRNRENLANGDDPLDVAKCIEKIFQASKPHLRYQFGAFSESQAVGRYKDVTGDQSVQASIGYLGQVGLLPNPENPKNSIKNITGLDDGLTNTILSYLY